MNANKKDKNQIHPKRNRKYRFLFLDDKQHFLIKENID